MCKNVIHKSHKTQVISIKGTEQRYRYYSILSCMIYTVIFPSFQSYLYSVSLVKCGYVCCSACDHVMLQYNLLG